MMKITDRNDNLLVTRLKSDYLQVKYSDESGAGRTAFSFGGCQSWFKDTENGEIIKKQGCGLIAMSDVILYLSVNNTGYSSLSSSLCSLNNPMNYNDYLNFVLTFNREYVNLDMKADFELRLFKRKLLSIYTNNIDGKMGKIINNFFNNYNIPLKAKWGLTDSSIRIKNMISNDIPAIISVGPLLSGKMNGISCYETDENNYSDNIVYKYTGRKIINHYFTVTAVIENKLKNENNDFDAVMYEVSSWGKKYYVSKSEIKKFCRYNSSFFTNVLYIEKK